MSYLDDYGNRINIKWDYENKFDDYDLLDFIKRIQYAEIKSQYLDLGKITIGIPSELMLDNDTKREMSTRFNLFEKNSSIVKEASEFLYEFNKIREFYIHKINGFGNVILVAEKPKLEENINSFNRALDGFKKQHSGYVQEVFVHTIEDMIEFILSVADVKKPLWFRNCEDPRSTVTEILKRKMTSHEVYLQRMQAKIVYKNATIETIKDMDFAIQIKKNKALTNALRGTRIYNSIINMSN